MDQTTGPENTRNPRPSTKVTKIIGKIDHKAKELVQAGSIDIQDLEKVKARLSFAWCEEPRSQEVTTVTSWRDTAARTAYSQVQNINDHLLLPFVLAVPPTECSTPAFKEVLRTLQRDQYKSYRLSLSHESKILLQSLAIDCGFMTKSRYLTFIGSLFPPGLFCLIALRDDPNYQTDEPLEEEQARRKQDVHALSNSANAKTQISSSCTPWFESRISPRSFNR